MIFDSLKHMDNYKGLGKVYDALTFLKNTDFSKMAVGRYELNDDMFYMVQEYEPTQKVTGEAHKSYIDVQYLISGTEVLAVAPIDGEKELAEARPEKDVWFYTCKAQPVILSADDFMVLYPNDIHQPGPAVDEPVTVRKIVVKVKI